MRFPWLNAKKKTNNTNRFIFLPVLREMIFFPFFEWQKGRRKKNTINEITEN